MESIDELSILASVLGATSLGAEFSNPTLKGTLFAPTNEAILRFLPHATVDSALRQLGSSPSAPSPLQALALLHSVPSPFRLQVSTSPLACMLSREWGKNLTKAPSASRRRKRRATPTRLDAFNQ